MRRAMMKMLVGLLLLGLLTTLSGAAAAPVRSSVTGRYALVLDGVFMGWLNGAEGGYAYADVVVEPLATDYVQRKHIGNVKYEEITVKVGAEMAKGFYQWMQESLEGQYTRKSGAIIAADYNNRETQRIIFTGALITAISFPALDASSREPAYLTIKIAPETARRVKGSGTALKYPTANKQKQWLVANFRLRIDGLDKATSRVNKVEAITVKQKVLTEAVGERRDWALEPTQLELSDLAVTFSEVDADPWYAWHESFVINGNNGPDQEKSGRLEFLSPNLKDVLFSLDLSGLGIFKLAPEKVEAGSEQIRRLKAEMYLPRMSMNVTVASSVR